MIAAWCDRVLRVSISRQPDERPERTTSPGVEKDDSSMNLRSLFPAATTIRIVTTALIGMGWSSAPCARADEESAAATPAGAKSSVRAPYVNAMDFGAHPENQDNTAQIQRALSTGKKVMVPPGNYAVNGTLDIGESQYLHLAHGAWLRRLATQTANTKPVVRLSGNFSRLTGEGEACGVSSENASGGHTGDAMINNGVVNVGPASVVYDNINFWVIDSICIQGSVADWRAYQQMPYPTNVDQNELLTLVCSASLSAGRGSCYLGRVSHCLFQYGGVAIKANPICNGNIFTNNHFYRITHSCYFSDQTTENLFTNCFVHGDPGVTVIRLRKTGYNHFYGVMAEPGPTAANGRLTRFCDISADSGQNVLIGHGNTGHSYINKSQSSLIVTHATLRHSRAAGFGSISTNSLQTDTLTAKQIKAPHEVKTSSEHHDLYVKTFTASNPTEFQDVLTLTCASQNQVFMIDLSVTSSHESSSNHSSAKFIVSGKRGSDMTASASVDRIGGNNAITCRTRIDKNVITVQIKPSYYLHGQFILRVDAKSSGLSSLSKL
ncbi:MAG: hypothetical protein VX346_23180 [Planctomycetota bacterium]|nr:hypothetical protein [Planctomycetota bacterium]